MAQGRLQGTQNGGMAAPSAGKAVDGGSLGHAPTCGGWFERCVSANQSLPDAVSVERPADCTVGRQGGRRR